MDNYNWLLIIGIIFQLMLDFILIVSLLSPSENFFTKDDDNSSIQVKLAFILIVVSLHSLIIRYQRGESRRSSDEKLLQNPSIDSSENGGVPFSTEQESDGYHTKDDGRYLYTFILHLNFALNIEKKSSICSGKNTPRINRILTYLINSAIVFQNKT